VRLWRNWQTHQLEGLALAIAWWFESTQPHQKSRLGAPPRPEGCRYKGAANPFNLTSSKQLCWQDEFVAEVALQFA
jgi:hypothetical protein